MSFESLLPRPTIHHSPEGLLSTLIASVFCESMSPVPSVCTISILILDRLPRIDTEIDLHPRWRIATLKFFHVQ